MTADVENLFVSFRSDPGPREANEDTVLCIQLPDGRLLVAVADGMGGMSKGGLAGKTALGALYRHLSEGANLVVAMREANAAVYREGRGREMRTTLVAAVISGEGAEVANVGDCRAYQFDPLGLLQITKDHTLDAEAAHEGVPTEVRAGVQWAGALTRHLGAEKEVEVDFFGPLALHQGGWLLFCSDGLHRVLSAEEMEGILSSEADPESAAERFVEAALRNGTQDNVSVAIVFRPKKGAELSLPELRRRKESTWNPEEFLTKHPRPFLRRRKKKHLRIILPLVIIALVVGIVLVVKWWLGAGAG
jgi:protein phosphatase